MSDDHECVQYIGTSGNVTLRRHIKSLPMLFKAQFYCNNVITASKVQLEMLNVNEENDITTIMLKIKLRNVLLKSCNFTETATIHVGKSEVNVWTG